MIEISYITCGILFVTQIATMCGWWVSEQDRNKWISDYRTLKQQYDELRGSKND